MTSNVQFCGVGVPETVSDTVLADVAAEVTKIDHLYGAHPNHPFATHVGAILGAASCAMAKGNGRAVDAEFGASTLDHVCADHLKAALWLVGRLFQNADMDPEDVVRVLPAYVLDAHHG